MSFEMNGEAGSISPCQAADLAMIHEIINESAAAYKGVIPADRWHEPYMSMPELEMEINRGVQFHGYRIGAELVGVMGIQHVKDVTLIRHAYVRTKQRGGGIGSALLRHLATLTQRPVLIGTWKAATWAITFYQRHGYRLTDGDEKNRLLKTYWTIPDRQAEESVVLVDQTWVRR
jgi:GNAT superfamily N-acetyltransferase